MSNKSPFFWTDATQASERLSRTVILYDDQPVYIESIEPHEDGIPRARIRSCANYETDRSERKMLNSPKFKRFRELPTLGWINTSNPQHGALYAARRIANTRRHGLSGDNVTVTNLDFRRGDGVIPVARSDAYGFRDVMFDKGFIDNHNKVFPPLDKILSVIKESSCIAFSPLFCVVRSADGLRWMYRGTERIGIFTGVDTLNLISKFSYLREEIMSEKAFTLNNLREF